MTGSAAHPPADHRTSPTSDAPAPLLLRSHDPPPVYLQTTCSGAVVALCLYPAVDVMPNLVQCIHLVHVPNPVRVAAVPGPELLKQLGVAPVQLRH